MGINVKISLAFLFLVLSACGTGQKNLKLVKRLNKVDSDKTLIIGRVEIAPRFQFKQGAVIKPGESKDPAYISVAFSFCDQKAGGEEATNYFEGKFGKKCHFSFKDNKVKMGEFFALEVEPSSHFSWIRIFTATQRSVGSLKALFNRSQKTKAAVRQSGNFYSYLQNFYFISPQALEAGKAYYIGSLKVQLAKEAFLEIGDEEYDLESVSVLSPKKLEPIEEYKKAQDWARSFGLVTPLEKLNMKLEPNKVDSFYKRIIYR